MIEKWTIQPKWMNKSTNEVSSLTMITVIDHLGNYSRATVGGSELVCVPANWPNELGNHPKIHVVIMHDKANALKH